MPQVLSCPGCGQKLQPTRTMVGRRVKCPCCQRTLHVPDVAPLATPPPTESVLTPAPTVSRGGKPARPPGDPTPSPQADDTPDGGEQYHFLAPAEKPDELGRLGPYRVLRVLGAGGMGVVFQAEDPLLKRSVALKAMLPHLAASARARQRFLREAQAAAAVEHDHVVPIYQVGEDRGVPFLAMPLLQGEPLEKRLQREPRLPVAEALRIGREVALGLAAAHQRGLIHRDIKPGNIWLETRPVEGGEGSSPACPDSRVKILDFGLARAAEDSGQLTQSGAVVGTPAYMAPEQAGGAGVDARCDLFSLGCVLYRMCTGRLPFEGNDLFAVLAAVALQQPRPPRDDNPEVPAALSDLVLRLLEKTPAGRPASAREVVEALDRLRAQAGAPPALSAGAAVPPTRRPERADRRRRLAGLVAGGLLAVGVGGGLAALLLSGRSGKGNDSDRPPPVTGEEVRQAQHQERPPPARAADPVPSPKLDPNQKNPAPQSPDPVRKPSWSPPPRSVVGKGFAKSLGMKLVPIAAGAFPMGTHDRRSSSHFEKPRHPVQIRRPFYLAAHKTTQAQFLGVMGRNPSWFSVTGSGKDVVKGIETRRFPVEEVTYFDAVEFCNTLSEREGRPPCYRLLGVRRDADGSISAAEVETLADGTGYRLPSEAEWEYAARAGTTTRYWFGEELARLDECAWFMGNSGGRTQPVGEKKPNPWGLYDMGGLAAEWCQDFWHENYVGAPMDGSAWRRGEAGQRVTRAGSWSSPARLCHCAARGKLPAGLRNRDVGFRVVLVSP